ncbi:MAG TPA: hypothetical protein VJZ06_00115 [Mobilitalea sp.]|nr:hypothetical protein [Mobilitalea sp.]
MDNNSNRGNDKREENERRADHLVNLVEKKTRTERHLEEHSDISSSQENIEHVKELQQDRQVEIDNLKNILAKGEKSNNNQIENTEKRFVYTEGYLNHNADHMDREAFKNAMERQRHRKEELDSMK